MMQLGIVFNWKTVGVVVVLAVVGWLGLSQLGGVDEASASQDGDVTTVFVGDLSASANASGQVEAVQSAQLSVDTAGQVVDVYVREGDTVGAGDPLLQLDTTELQIQLKRAEQNVALQDANLQELLNGTRPEEIAASEAAAASAQASLDSLLAGPSEYDIAEAEANNRSGQADVASANASYNSVLTSVSDASIGQAQIDLANAQQAYNDAFEVNDNSANGNNHEALLDAEEDLLAAQQTLAELQDGPSQGSISSAAGSVSAASANLSGTQADYEALLAGASAQEIASAEANLAQAQSNLESLIDSTSDESITIAEEELRQAELSLRDAEEALTKATVTAPFAGTITAVDVAAGEYASGVVAEIVSSDLKVTLEVDEIDIGQIAVGQEAVLTMETWPDVEIGGVVSAIAPQSTADSDTAAFDVTIAMDETTLPVLVGMTANARLMTADFSDLLLVPNGAITSDRTAGTYSVELVVAEEDGQLLTETVEVTIGFKDQEYTEITSGLNEGDEVLMGKIVAPIDEGGFGPGK